MARNEQKSASAPAPGSIAEVVAHLTLWATAAPRGLARVEYTSEFARERAVEQLREALAAKGIPFHEIELPRRTPASQIVGFLVERLGAMEPGAVCLSGFATAFPAGVSLEDSLRVLNFNRENLALFPLRQIWWMTPAFSYAVLHAIPDLHSWFTVRLQLTEIVLSPVDGQATLGGYATLTADASVLEADLNVSNPTEARGRAAALAARFERALAAGAADVGLLDLALAAARALVDAGSVRESSDVMNRFDQMYGRVRSTNGEVTALFPRAPEIWKRALGPSSSELATRLNNLATLYRHQQRFDEAERLYLRTLEIDEKTHGVEHPNVIAPLSNLASVYEVEHRYAEAERLLRRALSICEKAHAADSLQMATVLNNLANLYDHQSRYAEAETLHQRALAIREKVLGSDHPLTATSLNNLASVYQDQGRFAEAESLFQRALAICEKVLGPDHFATVESLNNLAGIYYFQGRFGDAAPLVGRALAIYERALGPDHPSTAVAYRNYACLLQAMGREVEAEAMFAHADKITKRLDAAPPAA